MMNERIKILAIEAEKLSLQYANKNNVNFVNAFNTVFAELIVRECGKVYIQNQQDGVMTLTQDLLQHFGVEE